MIMLLKAPAPKALAKEGDFSEEFAQIEDDLREAQSDASSALSAANSVKDDLIQLSREVDEMRTSLIAADRWTPPLYSVVIGCTLIFKVHFDG